MKTVDRRSEEQKGALPYLVVGYDRFMSGWGLADGGASYAAWACSAAQLAECEAWVRSRGDMEDVIRTSADDDYRPPQGCVHLSIYVWKGDDD